MPSGVGHFYGTFFDPGPNGEIFNLFGYRDSSQYWRPTPELEDGTDLNGVTLIDAVAEGRRDPEDPVNGVLLANPDHFFEGTMRDAVVPGDNSGLLFDTGLDNGMRKDQTSPPSIMFVAWGLDVGSYWPAGTQLRIKVAAINNSPTWTTGPSNMRVWVNGVVDTFNAEGNDGTVGFNEIVTVNSDGEIWFKMQSVTTADTLSLSGFIIEEVPNPPTTNGTIPNLTGVRAAPYSQDLSSYINLATSYSLAGAPVGSSFDTSTGVLTWAEPVIGTTSGMVLTGTNVDGTVDSNAFDLTITAQAPIITDFDDQADPLNEVITPLDTSLNIQYATSYSATGLPTGLTIDSGTGIISGTPTVQQAFTTVQITGTNEDGSTQSNLFTWTIGAALPRPEVTDINNNNGMQRAETITITGTNMTGLTATYNGISLTVTNNTATSADLLVPAEGLIFGAVYPLVLTNDQSYSNTFNVQFRPEPGYGYVTMDVAYAQLPINSFMKDVTGDVENVVAGTQVAHLLVSPEGGNVSINSLGVVDITGVPGPGNHTFTYYFNDASDLTISDNYTSVVTLVTTGDDISAPSWTSPPTITEITQDRISFSVTMNEQGTIWWGIINRGQYSNAAIPTPEQLKAGTDGDGNALFQPTAFIEGTNTLAGSQNGFPEGTAGTLLVVAADDEDPVNTQPFVSVLNFTTLAPSDNEPPVFTVTPAVTNVVQNSCVINAEINEVGLIHWAVFANNNQVVLPSNVIGGVIEDPDSSDGDSYAYDYGSGASLNNVLVDGLPAGTALRVCFFARDTSLNAQVAVTTINITTPQAASVRSLTALLVDSKTSPKPVANTQVDYMLFDEWGTLTESGTATTDNLGNLSFSGLVTSVGPAWLVIRATEDYRRSAAYLVDVVESG